MVSDLTGWSVSQDSISRLERGLPVNNVLLAAAVDRALGADGRLASVPYRPVVDGKIEVVFPAWWVGPIWIQIDGAAAATLTWTPYVKRVQVDGDSTTLHTRCADPAIPLRIEFAPTSVKGMIGLGRRDDAFDINERWQPASVDSLNQVMHAGEELALRIFKRSRSTLTALVRARRQKVR